ncbi:MAG: hypothetical protein SFX73_24685 [Kofleriaceae bacterium]|nr:hypothetical protein [Kofleriaceae bacterium]
MSRVDAVLAVLQSAIRTTDEALDPHEQDIVYRALLDHVRARRPESVGFLSQLPPPGPIRDPRGEP